MKLSSLFIILETGGHRSIKAIPVETHIVMDIKLPASGEEKQPFAENFSYLKKTDEIKFVVQNKNDFEVALDWIKKYALDTKTLLLFSAVWGQLHPKELAEWLLSSKIQARLQVQLHKTLWGSKTQGV